MADFSSRPFELPRAGSAGDLLLDKVVQYFMADGDPRDSLRGIAQAIGTSHRMLQYHFGTKERLLGAAFLRFREILTEGRGSSVPIEPPFTRGDYIRMSWEMYRRPENFLMLELLLLITNPAAGALTDESLMKQLSSEWSEVLVKLGIDAGLDPARAEAEARLVRSAWRGLHGDLYGTGDAAAVDAAVNVLIDWVDAPR